MVGDVAAAAANGASPATARTGETPSPPRRTPAPSASATPIDTDKMLEENDRMIAENNRMVAVLQGYSRSDSAKLDRLTSECSTRLGASLLDEGARRVFDCIQSSW